MKKLLVLVMVAFAILPALASTKTHPIHSTHRMNQYRIEATTRINFRAILGDKRNMIFTVVAVSLLAICVALYFFA